MSSRRITSAGIAATAALALSPAIAFGQISPPSTSIPAVTTPTVSVEAPSVPVPTPPVQAEVPATTVQAPTVTADTPTAPVRSPSATVTTPAAKVSLPSTTVTSSAPQVRAPSTVTTPSRGAESGTGSTATDRSSAGRQAPGRAGTSGSAPAGGSSRANGSRAASRAGGPAASASRRGRGPAAAGGERRRARGGYDGSERGTPAQRDRRLRQTVQGLAPCVTGLPDGERSVLALRAGLGAARSRSRGEVAHITGLSRARVRRAEISGLRRLRRLARTSGCGTSLTADAPRDDAAILGGSDAPPRIAAFARPSFATAVIGTEAAPGISVLAERERSAPDAEKGSSPGSGPYIGPPDGSGVAAGELSIALVAMMALSILALGVLRLRRGRHRDRWDPSAPW